MESILTSIKKLLGISEEYEHFDSDIIMHINSALMILTQLGVGPEEGFLIEDSSATWQDFLGTKIKFEAIKSYIYLRVKLLFDPPSSAVIASIDRQITELEWRININAESGYYTPDDDGIDKNTTSVLGQAILGQMVLA